MLYADDHCLVVLVPYKEEPTSGEQSGDVKAEERDDNQPSK